MKGFKTINFDISNHDIFDFNIKKSIKTKQDYIIIAYFPKKLSNLIYSLTNKKIKIFEEF